MPSQSSKRPGTNAEAESAKIHKVEGVQVYARMTRASRPVDLDAIDQDEEKIRDIADRLFRRGFGVMRQRSPRAGKVFYLFKATWPGPGEPPDDPFSDD